LKILYLTKFIVDRHGFARSFHLAKGLVRRGHEVTFIAASEHCGGYQELRDGVQIVTFFDPSPTSVKKGGLSLFDMVSRLWFARHKSYDLIMVDSGFRPVTGLVGHLLARWKKIPYVCEWWDWIGKGGLYDRKSSVYRYTLGYMDCWMELWDKRHADGVVALSTLLQQRCQTLGLKREQTCVIHGGCDSDDIVPLYDDAQRLSWRACLNIPQHAVVIGFAGLDSHEVEDMRPFLSAVHALKQRYPQLYWFSTGGTLHPTIRDEFQVGDEYRELGWVNYDEYVAALVNADILLLTQEDHLINKARWPNKLGDYMAAGRPVLVTAVGEVTHFANANPDHGLFFVEWNSRSIIQACVTLIEDLTLSDELGKKNRNLAENTMAWDAKSQALHDFLCLVQARGK
jgi:glycosyltransferase involved in cell wall biosynthesis